MLGVKSTINSAYSLNDFAMTSVGVCYPINDPELEQIYKRNENSERLYQLFQLSPDACKKDISTSLMLAKQRFSEEGLVPMGCLMFTCNGRGPEPNEEFFDG